MSPTPTVGVSRAWRTIALGLTAGVAAHVGLSLRRPAVVDPTTVITVRDLATAAAADPRLDRVLDAVDCDGSKLSDVLQSLGERGKINVVVDWHTLADVGVTPDQPVTLHLRDVRWSSALDAVLLVVDPEHKAGWTLRGDLVSVTSGSIETIGPPVTRLYDVRPLLDLLSRRRPPPQPTTIPTPPGQTQFQSSLFQNAPYSSATSDEEGLDEIKTLVQQMVDPNSWKDNGGDLGSIGSDPFGDLLITQSEQNQRRVAAALQLLVRRH